MSARLSLNPIPIISWKGKTMFQITGQIRKNNRDNNVIYKTNLFKPQPLKIYRREIVTNGDISTCNSRMSASIDNINMPNGFIVTEHINTNSTGLVHVLEKNVPNDSTDNGMCTNRCANVDVAENARRRVRSSGMIKRTFKPQNKNDNAYFTNNKQYLVSRNRTFAQNQYTHIRKGDMSLLPNNSQYNTNVYSPNGLSHCRTTAITQGQNDTFYYLWTNFNKTDVGNVASYVSGYGNGVTANSNGCYKVVIPPGDYTVEGLQAAFQQVLLSNRHYFIHNKTGEFVFLIKLIFNAVENKIELQSFSEKTIANSELYSKRKLDPNDIGNEPVSFPVGYIYKRPTFYFPANSGFASMVGFASSSPAFYPNLQVPGSTNESEISIGFLSTTPAGIFPLYDILYFKPSNKNFATQGAVTASSRLLRIKYDTITQNGKTYQTSFGSEVAAALSYNVSGVPYTIKDKYGYPLRRRPIFSKITGEMTCCKK
jgi:hypothetical protein